MSPNDYEAAFSLIIQIGAIIRDNLIFRFLILHTNSIAIKNTSPGYFSKL